MRSYTISDLEGLRALETDWIALEQHAELPMQQFFWAETCAEALPRAGRLRILVLEDAGQVVGIAPLFQRFKSPVYELLGVQEFFEPNDILVHPDYRAAMAEHLVDWGYLLWLNRIPKTSPLLSALDTAFHNRGILMRRTERSCPSLLLGETWREPEMHLNSGRRSDYRRALRIAQEFGPVTADIRTLTPGDVSAGMDLVFQVEAAGWKGQKRSAMMCDPLRGPFYRALAAKAAQRGELRLAVLYLGGIPAAMEFALEFKERIWLLKIGYDERFARCSPGNLLLREMIADAARRSLTAIEFLGTNEPWIRLWTSTERQCLSLRAYPFGIRGMRTFARDLMRAAWRRLERAA